jgi:ABC-type branched-subunit amino acid transport system permease subunit
MHHVQSTMQPSNPQVRVGTDEWVAQVEGRRQGRKGLWGALGRGWESIPLGVRYGVVIGLIALLPWLTGLPPVLDLLNVTDNAFVVRTVAGFLVAAMLAIGLNVVVGYAGLLDLGYVAFYGIAGYSYAYLSSNFVTLGDAWPEGIHLPTLLSLPLIVLFTALVGWLIGVVSMRLVGDYLAIITLGFGQVFIQLLLTATRVQLPGMERAVDLTRGPNGINDLDRLSFFGFTFSTTLHYYYLFLFLLILIYVAVDHLNHSRLGRAWRAMREDDLAAEAMGMPTRRLKLLAFAIGAAIAALAGVVDAAWQGNVVPNPRYSIVTLINLYGMVVLGGIGSLPGVVLGAFIFTILPEVLRNIAIAGLLFYAAGLIGLWGWLRPWRRFLAVVGGTILIGALLKLAVIALWPGFQPGAPPAGSWLNELVQRWLIIPAEYTVAGNVAVVAALLLLLATLLVRGRWHALLLGLTIYTFAFAWETRLASEPAATRILIVGATLVVLMIVRPQGLLGKQEVRVV